MSTRFFLINTNSTASGAPVPKVLSTQEPSGFFVTDPVLTVNGPATIQIQTDGGAAAWFSPPLKSGSISGNITINLWGRESNLAANVGFRVRIQIDGAGGGILYEGSEGIEFGTSFSQHQWIITPTPIVSWAQGSRIRVTVFAVDAGGTMVSGHNFFLAFNASNAQSGNSWVEFAENLSLDVYPTPTQNGPQYLKYLKRKKDYNEITVKSVFEDGGVDMLEHAIDASQRYEFLYDGLSEQDASVLDNFWNAHRLSQVFTLIEPRNEPWTASPGDMVEVQFESFDGDHTNVQSQSRKVVLVKYPVL